MNTVVSHDSDGRKNANDHNDDKELNDRKARLKVVCLFGVFHYRAGPVELELFWLPFQAQSVELPSA
ncbi:hypothetical protein D3C87_1862100 [compost metagenome]